MIVAHTVEAFQVARLDRNVYCKSSCCDVPIVEVRTSSAEAPFTFFSKKTKKTIFSKNDEF